MIPALVDDVGDFGYLALPDKQQVFGFAVVLYRKAHGFQCHLGFYGRFIGATPLFNQSRRKSLQKTFGPNGDIVK